MTKTPVVDKILTWLSNNPDVKMVAVVVLGLAALAIIAMFVMGFIQGRQISFWPPKIGEKPTKPDDLGRAGKKELVIKPTPVTSDKKRSGNFQPLSFSDASISCYDAPESPYGMNWVGGVPIMIQPYLEPLPKPLLEKAPADQSTSLVEHKLLKGHQIVMVGPNEDGSPRHNTIKCDIPNVKKVYVAWTAANGWKLHNNVRYEGRRIGMLELTFSDETSQQIHVVLGKNIREWIFRNARPHGTDVVSTISDPHIQFWESPDGQKTLDMIEIEIENSPKNLRSVNLIGQFETSTPTISGKDLPHFRVSAITCEVV